MDIDPPYSLTKQLEILVETWEEQKNPRKDIDRALLNALFKSLQNNDE